MLLMHIEKAHLLGISDAEWMSYLQLEGDVGYVSRTKEGRREMVREDTKEGRHPLDRSNSNTLTDNDRLYLSIFAG